MGRVRNGGGRSCARVDRLDPETLRLVQRFLETSATGRAAPPQAQQAWELFYGACAPLIHKLAHRGPARSSHDEEDHAQAVWLCLLAHLSQYDPRRGAFTAWLGSVVRNSLATQARCDRAPRCLNLETARGLPSREDEPSTCFERDQTRRDIESAASELRSKAPDITYQIVNAHCFEGRSFAEIAAGLGLPAKQVRDRHRRAIARLRRILPRQP